MAPWRASSRGTPASIGGVGVRAALPSCRSCFWSSDLISTGRHATIHAMMEADELLRRTRARIKELREALEEEEAFLRGLLRRIQENPNKTRTRRGKARSNGDSPSWPKRIDAVLMARRGEWLRASQIVQELEQQGAGFKTLKMDPQVLIRGTLNRSMKQYGWERRQESPRRVLWRKPPRKRLRLDEPLAGGNAIEHKDEGRPSEEDRP